MNLSYLSYIPKFIDNSEHFIWMHSWPQVDFVTLMSLCCVFNIYCSIFSAMLFWLHWVRITCPPHRRQLSSLRSRNNKLVRGMEIIQINHCFYPDSRLSTKENALNWSGGSLSHFPWTWVMKNEVLERGVVR